MIVDITPAGKNKEEQILSFIYSNTKILIYINMKAVGQIVRKRDQMLPLIPHVNYSRLFSQAT